MANKGLKLVHEDMPESFYDSCDNLEKALNVLLDTAHKTMQMNNALHLELNRIWCEAGDNDDDVNAYCGSVENAIENAWNAWIYISKTVEDTIKSVQDLRKSGNLMDLQNVEWCGFDLYGIYMLSKKAPCWKKLRKELKDSRFYNDEDYMSLLNMYLTLNKMLISNCKIAVALITAMNNFERFM